MNSWRNNIHVSRTHHCTWREAASLHSTTPSVHPETSLVIIYYHHCHNFCHRFWAKGVLPITTESVGRRHSSITKWAARSSQERFEWSEVAAKKPSKMLPLMASGEISQERFKRGSPNFTYLPGTIGLTELSCRIWRHWFLPVGCKIQLNTAQTCVKLVRLAKESNNSVTV